MLLGIKFSNLSREQKNLTKFAECWGSGTRRKTLCRVPDVCTRQNFTFTKCLHLALGKDLTLLATLTPAHGGRACWARARFLPSAGPAALGKDQSLPSALLCRRPALGEVWACRVPRFCRVPAVWHSANLVFAKCPRSGTR